MKAVITTAAAVAALAMAGSAAAQDWRLPANYGEVTLYAGFTPDPFDVNVTAGGSVNAANTIGGSCRGWISQAPDVQLNYSAGSYELAISANSNADTTLVINGPDSRWYCDDDGGNGLNPSLVWGSPMTGAYDIWVGSYNGSPAAATLRISELYTF